MDRLFPAGSWLQQRQRPPCNAPATGHVGAAAVTCSLPRTNAIAAGHRKAALMASRCRSPLFASGPKIRRNTYTVGGRQDTGHVGVTASHATQLREPSHRHSCNCTAAQYTANNPCWTGLWVSSVAIDSCVTLLSIDRGGSVIRVSQGRVGQPGRVRRAPRRYTQYAPQ